MHQAIAFDLDLIRRFDVPGPRYTSYPTADRFGAQIDPPAYLERLAQRGIQGAAAAPLSLYVHIPFCNTVCYYCGCNKIVTKDHSQSRRYLDYLAQEMALAAQPLGAARQASQMHWGGGTPTFLAPDEIRRLMADIRSQFELLPGGEYSIEIDPRKVSDEVVALLAEEGFNRMSIGIQDFDPLVQKAVNRIQSEAETRAVMDAARRYGFGSISVDLIYGLPHQNLARFGETLDRVLAMAPDRLSLYNYAHLPTRFMPQRRIQAQELPSPEEKLAILAMAIDKLGAAGYVFIGMDHFAKPGDELAVAQREGSLQRNFQGYSTHAECDMLAFGVSSIGKVGGLFVQNQRDIEAYYAALDAGQLPVMRGWGMSEDDTVRAAIIQQLMCHFALSFAQIEQRFGLRFTQAFGEEIEQLRTLHDDGLLVLRDDGLEVTVAGRMLVRIIAMVFDAHLKRDREQRRYSKVI